MSELRVLHICNWYPNVLGPDETPFVRRHIGSLEAHAKNTVWHIEVRHSPGKLRLERRNLYAHRTFLAFLPIRSYVIMEWATTLLLVWAWLTRDRKNGFDLVNIHIAYPLAMRTRALQRLFGIPIVLTEHWSAYHYSFNSSSAGLDRIRKIFHHDIPLICVSHALVKDIEKFSGAEQERAMVVDNVAETRHFHWQPGTQPVEGRFFAIAGWRFPKRPDVLIDMMALLRDKGIYAELRIAGDGPKMDAMKDAVHRHALSDRVRFLGHLTPDRVAAEMRSSHALLLCSDYETYSAVCAEALCTGTPVIASNVGGIPEYMTTFTGMLVENNDGQDWSRTLERAWECTLAADRRHISAYMTERASTESVGSRYYASLQEVLRKGWGSANDPGDGSK
jgi:glycosyltransferase involved in cell wall biosynthesis